MKEKTSGEALFSLISSTLMYFTSIFFVGWVFFECYNTWLIQIFSQPVSYISCVGAGMVASVIKYLFFGTVEGSVSSEEERILYYFGRIIGVSLTLLLAKFVWMFIG